MKANIQAFFLALSLGALLVLAGCDAPTKEAAPVEANNTATATAGNPAGKNLRKKIFAKGKMRNGKEVIDFVLQEEYLYDSLGNEIQYISHADGFNTQVDTKRDAEGREISKVRTAKDQTGKLEYRIAWNGDHTVQEEEEFSSRESRVVNKFTRTFDQDGKLLSAEQEDLHILDYPMKHKINFRYNVQGKLVEEEEVVEGKVLPGTKYSYSEKGELTRIDHFDSEGKLSQTNFYQYNKEGKRTQHDLQDHGGYFKTPQLEARYEYDAKGQLTKEIHYKGNCTESGQSSGDCPISETISYTYDNEGRVATMRTQRAIPSVVDMMERIEYSIE